VNVYRRLKPASFYLNIQPFSQAWRLGGLRPPHQYLSGAAVSPAVCIHRQLRPNDLEPACPGSGATVPSWATCEGHSLIPSSCFVTHVILVSRHSQADSAAFADDCAYGSVTRLAGHACRRYRGRTLRKETSGRTGGLSITNIVVIPYDNLTSSQATVYG
jgi:hypothetical protein